MNQKLKNFSINIIVTISTLLVVFLIAEIIVRVLYKQETVLFPRYHTDVQYGEFKLRTIRPNSEFWHTSRDGSWKFITNNKGFRNVTDFTYEKPVDTLRVLSIGDSHTQGYEVRQDHTFSSVIEKYLTENGIKSEVINAGVSGFSTAEALLFLENEGYKYKPDVVVLGFFANDYEDNLKASFFKINDKGELIVNKKEHIPGVKIQNIIYELPFVKFMSENSYFYSVMFNAVWSFYKTQLAKKATEKVHDYAIATTDKLSDKQVQLTAALIERMYEYSKKNNIKLIILDIPQVKGKSNLKTSVTAELLPVILKNSDLYISSDDSLSDYDGVAEIHVPHGHRHISEFTHTLYGVEAGKGVQQLLDLKAD